MGRVYIFMEKSSLEYSYTPNIIIIFVCYFSYIDIYIIYIYLCIQLCFHRNVKKNNINANDNDITLYFSISRSYVYIFYCIYAFHIHFSNTQCVRVVLATFHSFRLYHRYHYFYYLFFVVVCSLAHSDIFINMFFSSLFLSILSLCAHA